MARLGNGTKVNDASDISCFCSSQQGLQRFAWEQHTTREQRLLCVQTHFQASSEINTKYLALKLSHKFELRISGKTSWAKCYLYFRTVTHSPVFSLETILVDPHCLQVIMSSAAFLSLKCPNLDKKLHGYCRYQRQIINPEVPEQQTRNAKVPGEGFCTESELTKPADPNAAQWGWWPLVRTMWIVKGSVLPLLSWNNQFLPHSQQTGWPSLILPSRQGIWHGCASSPLLPGLCRGLPQPRERVQSCRAGPHTPRGQELRGLLVPPCLVEWSRSSTRSEWI